MKRLSVLLALALLLCLAVTAAHAEIWFCPACGERGNTGNFCPNCGLAKPSADSWTCQTCGQIGNTGNFCPNCGAARPYSLPGQEEEDVDPVAVHDAPLVTRLSTRTGPSTAYDEPGTFFNGETWKGQTVDVLTRAMGSGTWWLQVEFSADGSRYRVYTGLKRVKVNIDDVPEEVPLGTATLASRGAVIGFYGPGTDYAVIRREIPAFAKVTVYALENDYALIDFYDKAADYDRRAWVKAAYLEWD